jgi:ribosomal protein S12 methylthiotransferase accessory factor
MELAKLKALAEAVERHAYWQPVPMRYSVYADVAKPIPPESIVRYSQEQYESGTLPFLPFNPSEARWWVNGRSWLTGDQVSILADCVLSAKAFEPDYSARRYTGTSTSGCASGLSVEDAILRGALELVERDAYMRHWLSQLGGSDVVPETLPDSIGGRVVRLRQLGVEVGIRCLREAVYPSWLAWAQHESLHFTSVGSGSGLHAEDALKQALDELESGVLRNLLGGHDGCVLQPTEVATPKDHGALYTTSYYFRQADEFLKSIDATIPWSVADSLFAGSADAFMKTLARKNLDVYWVDLSVTQASAIADGRPMKTVRVVIPGLIPIAFGHSRLPLGMVVGGCTVANRIHPFA